MTYGDGFTGLIYRYQYRPHSLYNKLCGL